MQGTIRTRYTGPRGFAGSKIHASGYTLQGRRRLSVDYDDALNLDQNHAAAARAWLARHVPDSRLVFDPDIDLVKRCRVWTYEAAEVTA